MTAMFSCTVHSSPHVEAHLLQFEAEVSGSYYDAQIEVRFWLHLSLHHQFG